MCENTDSSCTITRSRPRRPLSSSGLSCFLLPTFLCSRQRKVGAAPHRGNANKPLTNQGKANALRALTNKRRKRQKTSSSHQHPIRGANHLLPSSKSLPKHQKTRLRSIKPLLSLTAREPRKRKSKHPLTRRTTRLHNRHRSRPIAPSINQLLC